MSIFKAKVLLRPVLLLLMVLCIFSTCVPVAHADEITDEPAASESVVVSELLEEMEATEETESVEGEITDAQYKAYVLGCLSFFVAVILFYFSYKFLRMFF